MNKHYVIPGDLTKFARVREDRRRTWDSMMEFKTKFTIDLMNQHASSALFNGPIGVIGTFFLAYSKDIPFKKRLNNSIHIRRPSIADLLYFLENVGTGIIFGNGYSIAQVQFNKIYTLDGARTELEIYSIDEN